MNPDPIYDETAGEVVFPLQRPADYALQRYRAWRRANRPFRRAFGGLGSERQRRILMEAGMAMAAERRRREAGL